MDFWQVVLHFDITNGTSKAKFKLLKDQLQSLADRKEDGRGIWSQAQWMQYGDRMNKHFFSLVRERPGGWAYYKTL